MKRRIEDTMTGCELNQIFLGEIAAVQNYGAFVRIPGCAQQGLIHKSQVSSFHVDDVGEVLQRGERVWCKIISINDEGKISLSMKLVNQGNGTDLDPAGVQLQRDEQKRKSSVPGQRKVIQLQAVLNTTCGKCGTHGHLSSDCFMSPDGKTYELIPEIEDEGEKKGKVEAKKPEVTELVDAKTKKHKSKKSKGKKKSKRSKSADESAGNDSEGEEDKESNKIKKSSKKRGREKKKDRKKDKKKSRDNSSQSYSTDNDNEGDNEGVKNSLKRKSYEHGRERRTKKCKYSSSKR